MLARTLLLLLVGTALLYKGMTHAAPSAMPPTVVTFGDSTTAPRGGVEVYTAVLEKETGPGVRWVNKGVPGNTTKMARKRFDTDVLAEKPAMVVIQFGINDSAIDVWKNPPVLTSRVAKERYEENLRHFVRALKERQIRPILMTPNPLRWTPALLERYGHAPYKPEEETGFTFVLAEYADTVRRVAREEEVPLVDIYGRYTQWEKETGRRALELLPDGMHPNSEGHRLVADALLPVIEEQLREAAPATP